MIRLFNSMMLSAALLVGQMAFGGTETQVVPPVSDAGFVLKGEHARSIFITGPIGGEIIDQAQQLLNLAETNKNPIYLVINSPGGAVLPGMQFLQAMRIAQREGVEIRCVVPVFAASMAFQIFAECNKRYAFETSLLLWHPMWMGGVQRLTHDTVKKIDDSFNRLEGPFIKTLRDALQVSDETFYKHYYWETWHTGLSLQVLTPSFMVLVDKVEGINNIYSLGQQRRQYRSTLGTINWIAPNWEQLMPTRTTTRLKTRMLNEVRRIHRQQ